MFEMKMADLDAEAARRDRLPDPESFSVPGIVVEEDGVKYRLKEFSTGMEWVREKGVSG